MLLNTQEHNTEPEVQQPQGPAPHAAGPCHQLPAGLCTQRHGDQHTPIRFPSSLASHPTQGPGSQFNQRGQLAQRYRTESPVSLLSSSSTLLPLLIHFSRAYHAAQGPAQQRVFSGFPASSYLSQPFSKVSVKPKSSSG